MNLNTLDELEAQFSVKVDSHHDRDELIPVSNGLQRQGDVIVIPTPDAVVEKVGGKDKTTPLHATLGLKGHPVVRGENGGNTHLLLPAGEVTYRDLTGEGSNSFDVCVFTVAEGATAYLAHPEHGYMGIGAGTYTVRRQQEKADEIRMVQD